MSLVPWAVSAAGVAQLLVMAKLADPRRAEHRRATGLSGVIGALAMSAVSVLTRADLQLAFFALDAMWPPILLIAAWSLTGRPFLFDGARGTPAILAGILLGALGVAHAYALRLSTIWQALFYGTWQMIGLI